VAQAENQRFPYEVLLRSVLKHLVDASSNEFLFLIDFFKTQPKDTFNRCVSVCVRVWFVFVSVSHIDVCTPQWPVRCQYLRN
jgi:hypothetical protein